jgi:hypothetical protein
MVDLLSAHDGVGCRSTRLLTVLGGALKRRTLDAGAAERVLPRRGRAHHGRVVERRPVADHGRALAQLAGASNAGGRMAARPTSAWWTA